ncbi:hypothetical protein L209DRAFT_354669 [Thermothelomyces heterothallicus CBS 203.75]
MPPIPPCPCPCPCPSPSARAAGTRPRTAALATTDRNGVLSTAIGNPLLRPSKQVRLDQDGIGRRFARSAGPSRMRGLHSEPQSCVRKNNAAVGSVPSCDLIDSVGMLSTAVLLAEVGDAAEHRQCTMTSNVNSLVWSWLRTTSLGEGERGGLVEDRNGDRVRH